MIDRFILWSLDSFTHSVICAFIHSDIHDVSYACSWEPLTSIISSHFGALRQGPKMAIFLHNPSHKQPFFGLWASWAFLGRFGTDLDDHKIHNELSHQLRTE